MDTIETIDTLIIQEEDLSVRLDKLLKIKYPEYSRTYFQSLVEKGHVLINGQSTKKRTMLSLGDEIEVCFSFPPELSLTPENIPLDILFEDEDIIIVNKPAGMVVHPGAGHKHHTFVHALLYHCLTLPVDPKEPWRPGIVHRLDKDTSGILMAAKTSLAHRELVSLLSQRKVKKWYKAICLNTPSQLEISAPIKRHPTKRQEMAVSIDGKEALTKLTILAKHSKTSLLDVELITGRTHQIRVHLKHIGCPILGDPVYGSPGVNRELGITRQLLHAEQVIFTHPITGKTIHVKAPLPPDMQEWATKFFPDYTV